MKITDHSVLFIIGPTAVGKTALALQLARELNGEIISADSMQIYRGMDIGTGKPTSRERKKIRHHLVDICAPSRTFSVFDFHQRAVKAIREIKLRKKLPIVAGGTGFYVRALLEGLESSPPPDLKLRKHLTRVLAEKGLEFIVQKLSKEFPEKAKGIDLKNPRRVLRALEVSLQQRKNKQGEYPGLCSIRELGFRPIVIGVTCEREKLYQRIDERVSKMFLKGWVREVKSLASGRLSRTAKQAIGYSKILPLVRDKTLIKSGFESLVTEVQKDTRRYAKRQITWFRKEKVTFWIDVSELPKVRGPIQAVLSRLT